MDWSVVWDVAWWVVDEPRCLASSRVFRVSCLGNGNFERHEFSAFTQHILFSFISLEYIYITYGVFKL